MRILQFSVNYCNILMRILHFHSSFWSGFGQVDFSVEICIFSWEYCNIWMRIAIFSWEYCNSDCYFGLLVACLRFLDQWNLVILMTILHSRAEQSKAQQSIAQHSTDITAQHSTAQHSTAEHIRAQQNTAELRKAGQHSRAQQSTAEHSTAEHSTARMDKFKSQSYNFLRASRSIAKTGSRWALFWSCFQVEEMLKKWFQRVHKWTPKVDQHR